ncbi:hypothetical protein H2200_012008 [Cladophialophora chaetospira]|uniref:Myb-like DNA-binding domain-containing protein n=1 Tax=Cladophialophora chaetospira TaxID=386627 RepID=A0AA38WZ48_9EURO|nr:hypothetical protein H2200_012008 [Cladophialophora chaetospira]
MPPKAARVGATTSGVDNPAFQFVLSVLKHCEAIKPDWNEVAKENGIAYGKNATARFKSIVANHGLNYADGKLTSPGDVDAGTAMAVASPNGAGNATPKTPKSRGKKRKADDGDVVDGETPSKKTSAKKGKKSQSVVKEEDEAGSETIEVKEDDDAQVDSQTTVVEEVKSEAEE